MTFSILTLVTFFPLVGVLALLFVRPENKGLIRGIALGASLITFALSLLMWAQFNPAVSGFQLEERAVWIQAAGATLEYHLALDGISLWLVLLTTFLTPIAIGSAWVAIEDRVKEFMIYFLLLEVGMVGVFVAMDLFLFYVFWEFTLIPMYFLIGIWGGARRVYAAVKFFLFTLAGSVLMLVAILWLGFTQGTFSLPELLARGAIPDGIQNWLFLAFALAFAIKVPVWPLHSWLPDAHVEAPTAGSVILAGVLLKLGTYGLLRFNLGLFPEAAHHYAPLMVFLGVVGVLYGAVASYGQTDAKKLVAYSSVSHLGFVVLGLFSLTEIGIQGAVLQMVNHGLSTGALFLIVGMIYERRHTRELAEFGGLWKVMPVGGALMLVTTLASGGLPGLNGFVGEFAILMGAWQTNAVATTFAAVGVILAAVYLLFLFQSVFLGPVTHEENRTLKDLDRREIALLVPLIVLMVIIGLAPTPFFDVMRPAVEQVMAGLNAVAVMAR